MNLVGLKKSKTYLTSNDLLLLIVRAKTTLNTFLDWLRVGSSFWEIGAKSETIFGKLLFFIFKVRFILMLIIFLNTFQMNNTKNETSQRDVSSNIKKGQHRYLEETK